MVSGFIRQFQMTWYRQDFNIMPEPYWKTADTPDRIGMTEIGDIEGLYKMWDDLLAQHPGLRIDNCASGGRRLDIEMMSRSFSVWRTDHGFHDTLGGASADAGARLLGSAEYGVRNLHRGFAGEQRSVDNAGPLQYSEEFVSDASCLRCRLWGHARALPESITRPGLRGSSRPSPNIARFNPISMAISIRCCPTAWVNDTWTAWQWDRPEKKDGLVIVLRRPGSPFTAMNLNLQHLEPNATYEVEIRPTYARTASQRNEGQRFDASRNSATRSAKFHVSLLPAEVATRPMCTFERQRVRGYFFGIVDK